MKDDLLESFKQYHNANWHDGDNTFDERTYAKSNGEDFTDPFVQDCFDHYEAGYHFGYEKAYKELQGKIELAKEIIIRAKGQADCDMVSKEASDYIYGVGYELWEVLN